MFWENFWANYLSSVVAGITLLVIGGVSTYFLGDYIYIKFSKKFSQTGRVQGDQTNNQVNIKNLTQNFYHDVNKVPVAEEKTKETVAKDIIAGNINLENKKK